MLYKVYPVEDRVRIVDECSARIKAILERRYGELEEMRDAINDHYSFEDLYLRWDEVDNEEILIRQLLQHLESCTACMKADIQKNRK